MLRSHQRFRPVPAVREIGGDCGREIDFTLLQPEMPMDVARSGRCNQREIAGKQQRHLCRRNSASSEPCDKDGIKLQKRGIYTIEGG